MYRLIAAALPIALWAGTARAGAPPPAVCRITTVVDEMARELGSRAHYVRLDPALIQEEPTLDRRIVQCGVCAIVFMYDMATYGDQPLASCEPHAFSVLAVRNGYVVQYLR
jgi:hypothetical protein